VTTKKQSRCALILYRRRRFINNLLTYLLTYFLAQRHQTATKRSNLRHSDLRDNCQSGYDCVCHLTRVTPMLGRETFHASYILTKTNNKTQNSKILSIN